MYFSACNVMFWSGSYYCDWEPSTDFVNYINGMEWKTLVEVCENGELEQKEWDWLDSGCS